MNIGRDYIKCYLSEIGHNNFWYPSTTQAIALLSCAHDKLPWITGTERKLSAIKIPKSCVLPLSYAKKALKSGSPPATDDYTVVWIDR